MKKLDLHIHTKSTVSDRPFSFSMESLKKYVTDKSIDAIAITNHNLFDREQYDLICKSLSIKVFPGIEIDIEHGHLLLITEDGDLDDFEKRCEKIFEMNGSSKDSCISEDSFLEIFADLSKYLLIPHYDKTPELKFERIPRIKEYITCGEVTSAKKFISMKKNAETVVPVLFSDIRMEDIIKESVERQTYIDIDELSLAALKYSLMDKEKVSLSQEDGHTLFEVLDNGLKISNGLTVVMGKRSSGKTYTLNQISKEFENTKYIKQFSLLSTDEDKDKNKFADLLKSQKASVSETYLSEFKSVVEEVAQINLTDDEKDVEEYLKNLLQAATEAEKQDVYAKCKLFLETPYSEKDLSYLDSLIKAVDLLLKKSEYSKIIVQHIQRADLLRLAIAMREQYIQEKEMVMKSHFINDIVQSIQKELQVHSSNTHIKNIDFYQIMMNREKISRFEKIVKAIKKERVIEEKSLYPYKIVAKTVPFTGAKGMKELSRSQMAFSDVFENYDQPYQALKLLIQKEGLPSSEYYKYFVNINYEVLNKYGSAASGGERSEYNLLQALSDAARSEVLILDEPESSFDNIFLKDGVNKLLKDLSKIVPVIVATHNNTIGASVHPDYIIYTEKEILPDGQEKYHLYSGYPSSLELTDLEGNTINKKEILLDCLEAGEPAYMERRASYEILKN